MVGFLASRPRKGGFLQNTLAKVADTQELRKELQNVKKLARERDHVAHPAVEGLQESFRQEEGKGQGHDCVHLQRSVIRSDSPSGKTETLFELLDTLVQDGQKVLVFSQFVQMLTLLEKECHARNIKTHLLTGQTKDRQEVVNAFQSDPYPGVFLLSLRAAGTGLNLTNASYVVLYDPWWNPAVEAQAIDRSHRMGQTQTVNAYRLIAPGTVEEKIWELQQSKAKTIADVLGEEGFASSLTKTDLEYLFSEE